MKSRLLIVLLLVHATALAQSGPKVDPGWISDPILTVSREFDGKPHLAVGPRGVVHIASCGRNAERTSQVYYRRSRDGGRSFDPARIVDQSQGCFDDVQMAVDPRGDVLFAWQVLTTRAGPWITLLSRLTADDDVFTPPIRIKEPSTEPTGLGVAVDDQGRLHLLWGEHALSYQWSIDSGSTLSRLSSVVTMGSRTWARPAVATGPGGKVYIAWRTWGFNRFTRGQSAAVYFARSVDSGKTFSKPVRLHTIDPPLSGDSSGVRIEVVSETDLTIIWPANTSGPSDARWHQVRSTNGGTTWGRATTLEGEAGINYWQTLVDPAGTRYDVWISPPPQPALLFRVSRVGTGR